MDLASSEYLHSFTFRLRGREKVFLQKIDHALEKIRRGHLRHLRAVWRADLDQAPRGAPGDDALHPLQRGPGAHREGVRLRTASGGAGGPLRSAPTCVASWRGCGVVLGRWAARRHERVGRDDGRRRRAPAARAAGRRRRLHRAPRWRVRHSNWGTESWWARSSRASRAVDRGAARRLRRHRRFVAPERRRVLEHNPTRAGATSTSSSMRSTTGRPPRAAGRAMLRFAPDGRAVRWSPAHGLRAPAAPVPALSLRRRPELGLVRALLDRSGRRGAVDLHPAHLAASLLREAARRRARIRRWSRAPPHPARAHATRSRTTTTCTSALYCDPADRASAAPTAGPCAGSRRCGSTWSAALTAAPTPRRGRRRGACAPPSTGELPPASPARRPADVRELDALAAPPVPLLRRRHRRAATVGSG